MQVMLFTLRIKSLVFILPILLSLFALPTSTWAEEARHKKEPHSLDFTYIRSFINPLAKLPRTGHEASEHSLFYFFDIAKKPEGSDQTKIVNRKLAQTLEWPEDVWKPKGVNNIFRALIQWSDVSLGLQRNHLKSLWPRNTADLKEHIGQWVAPSPVHTWVSVSYIDIYTGPNEDYPAFYIAEKNQPLLLLSAQADWIQVQVQDGTTGWIKDQILLSGVTFRANKHSEKGATQVERERKTKQPVQIGLHTGLFDTEKTLFISAQRPLFQNISLHASIGEIIGEKSDAQLLELKLRHQPDLRLPLRPFFDIGTGLLFNTLSLTQTGTNDDANIISVGLGVSYAYSSRLNVNLQASNYHAFFNDTLTTSFQAYSLGIQFQNSSKILAAIEKSANRALLRNNRILGAYIGSYQTEAGDSSIVSGLSFIYRVNPNNFIETSWGQADLDTNNDTSSATSLTYYRFSLAHIAFRSERVVREKTLRAQWYVLTGLGTTRLQNQPFLTASFGAGVLLETGGRAVLRIQAIDQISDTELFVSDKITHNPELSLGAGLRF